MTGTTTHDPRCERSTAKRCRCTCEGRQHGTARHGETGTFSDESTPGVLATTGQPVVIESAGSLFDLLEVAR